MYGFCFYGSCYKIYHPYLPFPKFYPMSRLKFHISCYDPTLPCTMCGLGVKSLASKDIGKLKKHDDNNNNFEGTSIWVSGFFGNLDFVIGHGSDSSGVEQGFCPREGCAT